MPIKYTSGDIFLNGDRVQAFAHGCNCQGAMGAGIALAFKKHYPDMYSEYRRRCKAKPREFNLGDAFLWKENDKPFVFNLGTQEQPGPNATYEAIEMALRNMLRQAEAEEILSVAMPLMGSGHGGLEWKRVVTEIEAIFGAWRGNLFVYVEFLPE